MTSAGNFYTAEDTPGAEKGNEATDDHKQSTNKNSFRMDKRTSIKVEVSSLGVAVLVMDCPGKTNVLDSATMIELREALRKLAGDRRVKALVVMSGKADHFASGADLHEILRLKNSQQAYQLVRSGQEVFNQLVQIGQSGKPIVVGIHGACLGGGLELALCGNRRIATADDTTKLGLPEVKIGLIPALGGTQRLPTLIGVKRALDLIVSSTPVSAFDAHQMGLVDELVAPDELQARLEACALSLADGTPVANSLVDSGAKARALNFHENIEKHTPEDLEKQKSTLAATQRAIRMRTRGNYPAFNCAIDAIREGLTKGLDAGLEYEARAFSELAVGEVARNLINLFFSTEVTVRAARSGQPSAGPASSFGPASSSGQATSTVLGPIHQIGILGGGLMGCSIAYLTAHSGYSTVLREIEPARLSAAIEALNKRLATTQQTVHGTHSLQELNGSQLVVEAIPEDLEAKLQLFAELAQVVSSECLLATNTSCLSVSRIAQRVPGKNRFLGMHFFHPVEHMQLVELIIHQDTSAGTLAAAAAVVADLGKVPVVVKDGPGFLVNRILCPYLAEAARIAEQGVPLSWIEEAAIAFGMPVGPFALMDEIGLDVSFKVAKVLYESFGERLALPKLLHSMESLGLLGKKGGAGFYNYTAAPGKPQFNPELIEFAQLKSSSERLPESVALELQYRLILPMVDEAARCLEEKIVNKARNLDLAMVTGVGFPSFRGGLLRYADRLGMVKVIDELGKIYSGSHLPRKVADSLVHKTNNGGGFYHRGSIGL